MVELPTEYVIDKFYQFASHPKHNKYTNVFSAKCTICHEGKSWNKKRRLYYITNDNYFYCQNCQRSWNPINWILTVSDLSYNEIIEEIKEYDGEIKLPNDKQIITKKTFGTLPADSINLFDNQQLDFYKDDRVIKDALEFIKKRKLNTAINKPRALFISLRDQIHKNRICIPFYDENNQIQFYQTRAIYEKDEYQYGKYLSKINGDKTVFGLKNIDPENDTLFLFEGPIDAMFVKNGIALGGITISELQREVLKKYTFYNKIWVLDNPFIDTTACDKIKKLIDLNERVFICPENFRKHKDINDICMQFNLNQISGKFILKNSFNGIKALMALSGN